MFILLQERMGKDPARTLADGVIAASKRAAEYLSELLTKLGA